MNLGGSTNTINLGMNETFTRCVDRNGLSQERFKNYNDVVRNSSSKSA